MYRRVLLHLLVILCLLVLYFYLIFWMYLCLLSVCLFTLIVVYFKVSSWAEQTNTNGADSRTSSVSLRPRQRRHSNYRPLQENQAATADITKSRPLLVMEDIHLVALSPGHPQFLCLSKHVRCLIPEDTQQSAVPRPVWASPWQFCECLKKSRTVKSRQVLIYINISQSSEPSVCVCACA